MHVTANGKAVLAAMSEAQRDAYIRNPLVAWTKNSITTGERLREEIAKVVENGFAASVGERDAEVHAVAAAILGNDGNPIAAMSISCPASRLPVERIPEYGALVVKAAAEISRNLQETSKLTEVA